MVTLLRSLKLIFGPFRGLEADQKVIATHGCYAMTATAALTAQNTLGVEDIHETPSEFVKKQIELCVDDVGVDVVKTGMRRVFQTLCTFTDLCKGMLASASTISVVADALRRYKIELSVIDPVRVHTFC